MTPLAIVPVVIVPLLFATFLLLALFSFPPRIIVVVVVAFLAITRIMRSIVPVSSPAALAVFLFAFSFSVFVVVVFAFATVVVTVTTAPAIVVLAAAAVIVGGRRIISLLAALLFSGRFFPFLLFAFLGFLLFVFAVSLVVGPPRQPGFPVGVELLAVLVHLFLIDSLDIELVVVVLLVLLPGRTVGIRELLGDRPLGLSRHDPHHGLHLGRHGSFGCRGRRSGSSRLVAFAAAHRHEICCCCGLQVGVVGLGWVGLGWVGFLLFC
jgi:hypothetical protein